jgi:hypothetical protein
MLDEATGCMDGQIRMLSGSGFIPEALKGMEISTTILVSW